MGGSRPAKSSAPFTLLVVVGLGACTPAHTTAPPPSTTGPGSPPVVASPGANAPPDAWLATCAAITTCGACLNAPPCAWCAGDARCVSPRAECRELRVTESSACLTAPLKVAERQHPELGAKLSSYTAVRETKTFGLAAFRQERFFMEPGTCFAVLSDVLAAPSGVALDLSYAVQLLGTPDPSRTKPSPEPGTGGQAKNAWLSPELCPFEPVYLVVTWLTPSPNAEGNLRLQLLTRRDPSPSAPASAPPPSRPPAARGGSCSDYECGEDCRSEHRACKLDCFRYGRHEMGSQAMCEAGCNQALRSCERGCAVPCP